MRPHRYIAVEEPDTKAVVDFLHPTHGVTVTTELTKNSKGRWEVYVIVQACDDRSTILGEILEPVPKADKSK